MKMDMSQHQCTCQVSEEVSQATEEAMEMPFRDTMIKLTQIGTKMFYSHVHTAIEHSQLRPLFTIQEHALQRSHSRNSKNLRPRKSL